MGDISGNHSKLVLTSLETFYDRDFAAAKCFSENNINRDPLVFDNLNAENTW